MAAVMSRAALGHVAIDSGGSWRSSPNQTVPTVAADSILSSSSSSFADTCSKRNFGERCLESSFCSSSKSSWEVENHHPRKFLQGQKKSCVTTRAAAAAAAGGGGGGGSSGSAIQEKPVASANGALQSHEAGHRVQTATMQVGKDFLAKPDLGNGLQMELADDGGFRETFVIRCYEVGTTRTASMETIANLLQIPLMRIKLVRNGTTRTPSMETIVKTLQEVACNHAQSVGFSTDGFATTPLMRERGFIWVTTRMQIKVDKYPVWGDSVEIETWFQNEGKVEIRRDWIIREDSPSRRVIARATSSWVMMNMNTRRLVRITDDIKAEYMPFVPKESRWAIPEEDSVKKITQLDTPPAYIRSNLMPRRNDLDMNHHVNNVTYIGWMLEGVPWEIVDTHELAEITLVYRRECKADDVVECLVNPASPETATIVTSLKDGHKNKQQMKVNGTASPAMASGPHSWHPGSITQLYPQLEFLHLLRLVAKEVEINRGLTGWRRRAPKIQQ